MTSKKLLLAGLVAALGLAGSVQAATVTITPTITAVLNEDFSAVDPAQIVGPGLLAARAEPYLLQVDINAQTTGLGGTAVGFANTAFNVVIHDDGTAYSNEGLGINAWSADATQFDVTGPGGPTVNVNKWDINSDDGDNKNDLQAIILAGITKNFGSVQFDIRRTLTQGDGDFAGSFYIVLPGAGGSKASATIDAAFGASTYDAEGTSSTAGNTAVGGSTETYQVVPEPSTVALLGLGSVLLAFARKRR